MTPGTAHTPAAAAPATAPATVTPVAGNQTMAMQVMNHVRDCIHTGEMKPEEWYSVYQLSEQLGISRSPVRDGLLRLEEAGIIEFVRNRGFRVIEPNPDDLAEIISIRLALEPAAAARAARDRTTGDIDKLHTITRHMEACIHAADEATFFAWDQELHDTILAIGHARRAREILNRLRTHTRLLSDSTVRTYRSLQQVYTEHLPIVAAIAEQDTSRAHKAMAAHITATGRLLLKLNIHKAHPDLAQDSSELAQLVDVFWNRLVTDI